MDFLCSKFNYLVVAVQHYGHLPVYPLKDVHGTNNGPILNSYSCQTVGSVMGCPFSDLWAEGCCWFLSTFLFNPVLWYYCSSIETTVPGIVPHHTHLHWLLLSNMHGRKPHVLRYQFGPLWLTFIDMPAYPLWAGWILISWSTSIRYIILRQRRDGWHIWDNVFKWFSSMKMFEFWWKCNWALFLMVQLTISQHWFR